jgi:predicted nucleic acid-binding protein
MKPSVYIETTIPSYLTAWRSPELVMAANQEATRSWWDTSRPKFDIFISALVLDEASSGDPAAAQRRMEIIREIPALDVSILAEELAARLLAASALPEKAKADALHIAIATVHGIDYLLTWNCKHIANATMRLKIESICRSSGYEPPIICTPLELMED